jgi:hypothetical protein
VSDEQAVRRVFLLALCREPTATEMATFKALLPEAPSRREALEDLFWAVLASKEFLFDK